MQQTIQLGQVQPSVLPQVEAAVKNLCEQVAAWWNTKNVTFTRLFATEEGEVFTHGQVVLAHLGMAAFIIILGVAGWLEGGAA
jgi:hypothetical protein